MKTIDLVKQILNFPLTDITREVPNINGSVASAATHAFCINLPHKIRQRNVTLQCKTTKRSQTFIKTNNQHPTFPIQI